MTTPHHPDSRLADCWTELMQPLGFSARSLWLMLEPDGTPGPLMEIPGLPSSPVGAADVLLPLLTQLADDIGDLGVAFLLTRPGDGLPDSDDLGWGVQLRVASQAAGLRCAGVHLAHDTAVQPLPHRSLRAA